MGEDWATVLVPSDLPPISNTGTDLVIDFEGLEANQSEFPAIGDFYSTIFSVLRRLVRHFIQIISVTLVEFVIIEIVIFSVVAQLGLNFVDGMIAKRPGACYDKRSKVFAVKYFYELGRLFRRKRGTINGLPR